LFRLTAKSLTIVEQTCALTRQKAAPRRSHWPARRAGEVMEIRTLMAHPMEAGLGQENGRALPRDMLARMIVRVNGETALEAEFRYGTAANPFHVFHLRIERTSEIEYIWMDEAGRMARASGRISVA